MRIFLLALVCLPLTGCVKLGFNRTQDIRESVRESEIREYYSRLQLAFAQGDSEALAVLFDPAIKKPMTHAQIITWGRKFFSKNGPAHFRIIKLTIDDMGTERAVVTLEYAVETEGGAGDFGGTEIDTLTKKKGRWLTAAWEVVP